MVSVYLRRSVILCVPVILINSEEDNNPETEIPVTKDNDDNVLGVDYEELSLENAKNIDNNIEATENLVPEIIVLEDKRYDRYRSLERSMEQEFIEREEVRAKLSGDRAARAVARYGRKM